MLGAPGAGKGTQAAILSEKLSIPTISTGNILRAAVKNGTPVGIRAKQYMEAGELVPDDVIIGIMKERMAEPDCAGGYILDGMPRTVVQADALDEAGIAIDIALSIEIDDEEIVQRLTGRRHCPKCSSTYHVKNAPTAVEGICDNCGTEVEHRNDDKPEVVLNRLKVYHEQTEPLKGYYYARGKLVTVENQPTIEATTREILKILEI